MQALDDNFCYSHSGLINGNLEKEKQLLVEEQKMCRARARKFFQETQRRRKALEERRKLWDVQEQRQRENVLQQRRQKVQEATERFQRAHLPPSQRRRQSCKRSVPTLEDALYHIQGSISSDNRQSSFTSISRISRSHTPASKTTTKPKPSPQRALSAVDAYTKLLQERSLYSLRNNPEIHEPKEDKPSDPQEDSFSDGCHSESVSSKDSLDSEESKHGTKYCNSLSSEFLLDTDSKKHSQQPVSPRDTLLGDTLAHLKKTLGQKQKKQMDYDMLKSKNGDNKGPWGIVNNEKAPLTVGTEHYSAKSPKNSTNDNLIASNGIPHTNAELDTPSPKQESALDLRQPKASDDRQLKHPSATEILLPTKNGSRTDHLFGSSKPNVFLNNCTMDNTCQEGVLEQAGRDNLCVSSRKDLSTSINNLNKISEPDDKAEKKRLNTEFSYNACPNSDHSQCLLKCCEKEESISLLSSDTLQRIHQVRFVKGILKKQSKYISGAAPCVSNSGRLTLTKQVALAIRDSVELTKAKSRDLESNSAVKKKLRWFDEVHLDSQDKGQDTIRQIRSKSSSQLHSKNNSEDHQVSPANVLGAIKGRPSMTRTVPNGYHFTLHAWADVGVQVNLPQQQGDEVRVQQRNNKTSGPKVSAKERAEAALVSSRTRKGTNMRPQSATEVSQIARPHGRLVIPHPPPHRTDAPEEQKGFVTMAPCGTKHATVNSRPADEHVLQREGLETYFPKYTNNDIRTGNGLPFMPHPPLYACTNSESKAKPKPHSSHPDTQACDQRAAMGNHDKGPCLKCTPTEEEISQLWLGVRTALATKDAHAALRWQVVESAENKRKNSATLGIRKPTHSKQPSQQTPDPGRMFSITPPFPDDDLLQSDHMNKVKLQKDGYQYLVGTAHLQPEHPHQRSQQGVTTISMEEERILQSLDRLNHRLHSVQEQSAGIRHFTDFRRPPTTDFNATIPQKHQAAANHPQCHRKV